MATVRDDSIAASIWQNMKVQCPICKKTFSNWYCPNCGLPKNNSSYGIYEDKIYYCGSNHFRREFGIVNEFQLCSKCLTPNPYNANYCRNCGEDITLHAKDKNGHGWIDLGLSVLWSTNSIDGYFQWNNTKLFGEAGRGEDIQLYEKAEKKDVATYMWGEKWRTPTKEEFEELIKQCKWEKYIIPTTNRFALKAIGPNGNSIVIPINSQVGSNGISFNGISLWSSTQEQGNNRRAYFFVFGEQVEFERTLTAKQRKRLEFEKSNEILFKVNLSTDEFYDNFLGWSYSKLIEEKRRRVFPQYEKTLEQQRKILDTMGDDRQEIADNIKKDEERRRKLWLDTPVEMHYNEANANKNTIRPMLKHFKYAIHPVADKKWQGKL